MSIPTHAVCPDHAAPFDVIADLFFDEVTDALVLGNRAGGKTAALAALHVANAYHKPPHSTAHIGAIQAQAKRCYAYYRQFLRHPLLRDLALDPKATGTDWENGSTIEILPGTEAQTQGGHPYIVTFDELEQGKVQPYRNAQAMPVEHYTTDGIRHPGQFVATSTRQSSLGMMQAALDEAEAKGTPIYTWCAMETMNGETCFVAGVPQCDTCPLYQDCEGRALQADGWRSRQEMIELAHRSDRDTWEAQHLCRKPDAKALIYAPFSKANISVDAVYKPGAGPLFLFYDWGYQDDTAILFCQYRDGRFYVFAELVGHGRSEREWVQAAIRMITELPGYAGPSYDDWGKAWDRGEWPDEWPEVWPEYAAGAPDSPQMRAEWKEHGVTTKAPGKVMPPIGMKVRAGQDVVRAAILTAGDTRRLFVSETCTVLIESMGKYRAKELTDGSFSPDADGSPANHAWSHCPDALRYGLWTLRRWLGLGSTGEGEGDGD